MVARWSLATIALGLFGIGCLGGGDPPPVPEDELPVVTLTPTRQDLTVPEDAVLVAEARYADGSLATGGHFQWSTGALPPLRREPPLEESPLEEGRSQATLRSPGTRGYLQVLVRWEVCDENGDHCRFTDQALSVVSWFGDTPTEIVPPTDAISLAVGERRPYQPFVLADGGERAPAAMSLVEYEVADTTIASVDEHGVLEGLSAGTTTLTLRGGTAEPMEVPLTVTMDALGPPPDGGGLISSVRFADFDGPTRTVAPITRRMGVDGRGWPAVLFSMGIRVDPYQGQPLYLAQWTGTGFGFEIVTPLFDYFPSEYRMDVDGDGAPVVVWFHEDAADGGFLRVATRPADRPTEWAVRDLPMGPTEVHPRYTFRRLATPGVLGDGGGGAWVAWSVLDDAPGPCRAHVRLARVTADAIETEDLFDQDIEPVAGISCHDTFVAIGVPPLELLLAPPAAGSDRPQLLVRRGTPPQTEGLSAFLYRHDGATWERRKVLPYALEIDPSLDDVMTQPSEVSLAWADYDDARAFAAWHYTFPDGVGRQRSVTWHASLDDLWDQVPPPRSVEFGDGALDHVYGLAVRDDRWIGMSRIGPMMRVNTEELAFRDDPISDVHPEAPLDDDAYFYADAVYGFAGRGDRIHVMWQPGDEPGADRLHYGVATSNAPSRTDDPETVGRRLGPGVTFTPVPGPMQLVMDDGTRVAFKGDDGTGRDGTYVPREDTVIPNAWTGGRLLRSDGPDAPFASVETSLDSLSLELEHLRARGSTLWVIDTLVDAAVWRSDDRGTTWSMWRAIPGLRDVSDVEFDENGTLWVYGGTSGDESHLGRFAQVASATTTYEEIDISGTPFTGLRPANFLVVDGGAVHLIAWSRTDARSARFGLDGRLLEATTGNPGDHGPIEIVAGPLASPDAWVLLGLTQMGCGAQLFVLRLARDLSGFERADIPGCWSQGAGYPPYLIRLPDGRLVAAGALVSGRDAVRASFVTSDDEGDTWTAPRALLPDERGRGQRIGGLHAEPGGSLLAYVGDDESLRGYVTGPAVGTVAPEGVGLPPLRWSAVRVDDP